MMLSIYRAETRAELTRLMRLPAYAIPSLAFPIAFYVFFAIMLPKGDAAEAARYMLATYGAFGSIGAALFGFGVGIAMERGQGWLNVKRASPMPPAAYIVAKVFGCFGFCAAIALAMCLVAFTLGHVELDAVHWLELATVLVFGALPFCAIGLAIGTIVPPNGAAAVVNLIYLPLSFCSGLWVPIGQLPAGIRHFANVLPAYHLGALALDAVGFGSGAIGADLAWLAGWAAVAIAVAVWAFGRDEGKTYG